jgi:hypothetical protein
MEKEAFAKWPLTEGKNYKVRGFVYIRIAIPLISANNDYLPPWSKPRTINNEQPIIVTTYYSYLRNTESPCLLEDEWFTCKTRRLLTIPTRAYA